MKKSLIKVVILGFIGLSLVGCGSDTVVTNHELPNVTEISSSSDNFMMKSTQDDLDAIKSQENILKFGYYKANTKTDEGKSRWYISQINGGLTGYIFSLMPIETIDGKVRAGWGEVSRDASHINIDDEKNYVGDIVNNYSYDYKDWGLGIQKHDPLIQKDIEMIRNTTVDIKWWFFKSSNGFWYIVNKNNLIYKFATENGLYAWQKINLTGFNVELLVAGENKKLKIVRAEELPQLNLNHKDETEEIKNRGCNFIDVSEYQWFHKYVIGLCQPGIIQGYAPNYNEFKPAQDVTWEEFIKVANLAYNYEEVKDLCSEDRYDSSSWSQCYKDYTTNKGFSNLSSDSKVRRGIGLRYVTNLYFNKNFEKWSDAGEFLLEKGVIHGEGGDGVIDSDYLNKFMNRAEMAKIVLNCSRISKEELPQVDGRLLPYSINPDDFELPQTILATDSDTKTLKMNGKDYTFLIPKPLAPKPPKAPTEEELPQLIVETAKENIGKRAPYVDKKNTIDTRLITTVYGQDVKYKTADEMCNDYDNKGKLKAGLPTVAGSVICYDKNTPGTDGKSHVSIASDDNGNKEIGVQDTTHGVVERPIDVDNVRGYIEPKDVELPSF